MLSVQAIQCVGSRKIIFCSMQAATFAEVHKGECKFTVCVTELPVYSVCTSVNIIMFEVVDTSVTIDRKWVLC